MTTNRDTQLNVVQIGKLTEDEHAFDATLSALLAQSSDQLSHRESRIGHSINHKSKIQNDEIFVLKQENASLKNQSELLKVEMSKLRARLNSSKSERSTVSAKEEQEVRRF